MVKTDCFTFGSDRVETSESPKSSNDAFGSSLLAKKNVNLIHRRVATVALVLIPEKVAISIATLLLLGLLRAGCSSAHSVLPPAGC